MNTITRLWEISGGSVKVVLCEPQRTGVSPLVVYLPGLGEPSEAGERWRMAWAAAGYAVLSVQPLVEDANAWSSELARAGDFKALGRQRYAAAAMNRRVTALAEVLTQAQHRTAVGDQGWQRVDWNRVVIAGFDLGADTAMAVAGERIVGDDETARAFALPIRAAVAYSPSASPSAGELDTRYLGVRIPVLSVTSDGDSDPLGLADGAAPRSAPFDHMAGPDKYLLSLQGLRHVQLSGSALPASQGSAANAHPQDAAPDKSTGGSQRGRGGRRQGSSEAGGSPTRDDRRGGSAGDDSGLSAPALQMRMQAAQDITTAFLDAHVKDDPRARAWLAAGASQWLGGSGELRRK